LASMRLKHVASVQDLWTHADVPDGHSSSAPC